MATIHIVQSNTLTEVTIGCVFQPGGNDADVALARAVLVAVNTDRRALDDDKLPLPTSEDRRGWWADTNADVIWGGWPIGVRLWLMIRDKILDANARDGATIERAKRYLVEALQPFVDIKLCSRFDVALERRGLHHIGGTITLFRGPRAAIALQYQELWSTFGS